jgi:hypothetical protein
MADSKGSMTSGLTAAINQTFKFGKIVVMAATFIVSTAFVIFLAWIAGKIPTKNWSLFLQYVIVMVGVMGAFYLMVSAMVAVGKMTASSGGGKNVGFIKGFALMAGSILKVVTATLVPVLVLVACVAVLWGIGLLGAIPKFGPIFWGIASFIPILVAIVSAFYLAKLLLTVFLLPGILGTTDLTGLKAYKEAGKIVKTRLVKLLAWFIVVVVLTSVFFTIIGTGLAVLQEQTRKTIGPTSIGVIGAGSLPQVLITNAVQIGGRSLTPNFQPGQSGAQDKTVITGGWFFGIEFGIIIAVLCACGYIFFAIGGMYAYGALSAEPEDPIALKVPVDLDSITAKAAKFTEAVSEKVKAELSEEEKKKGTKKE